MSGPKLVRKKSGLYKWHKEREKERGKSAKETEKKAKKAGKDK